MKHRVNYYSYWYKRLLKASLCLFTVITLLSATGCESRLFDKTVKTESGILEGVVDGDVVSFKGVTYAEPPVGDFRWRPPQPVLSWEGVRKATDLACNCMQIPFGDAVATSGTDLSEDCLVLNVWRPSEKSADPLPVMVWIPGGWYVNGGSSEPLSDGSALARQGLIVVSINYRLGRFGFFAHPAILAANEVRSGNFGYMDQIAALKWVQNNIASFGGNPDAVTIVGESAGGASVLHLLTSPAAKGLFHRAVVMSGGGRKAVAERIMTGGTTENPSADMIDEAFAGELGISGSDADALAKLQQMPAEEILRGVTFPVFTQKLLMEGVTEFPGTPMIDSVIVTDKLENLFLDGKAGSVPLMIGTTALDAPGFMPPRDYPFSYFGPDADKAAAIFNPGGVLPPELVILGIAADLTMHEPARFVSRVMTEANNPVWLYRFTYVAEGRQDRTKGAVHAGELPYMFQTVEEFEGDETTDNDRQMASSFSSYIANFVKTGNPNSSNLRDWPGFDPAKFDLMHFTLDDGPVFGTDPRAARIELVEKAADSKLTHH